MHRFIIAFLLCLSLTACVSEEKHQATVKELKDKVVALEKEVDELKNGPQRLLAKGTAELNDGSLDAAKTTFAELVERHKGAAEAEQAKSFLEEIERRVTAIKIDEENQRLAKEKSEKDKIESSLKSMSKKRDEVRNITWYNAKTMNNLLSSYVKLYIGKPDDGDRSPFIRLTISHYYPSDYSWIFVRSFTFNVDGEVIELKPDHSEFDRNNSHGSMWESIDVLPDLEHKAIIEKIISSKKTILRLNGEDRIADRTISDKEKKALEQVITAYKAMGGTW